MNNLATKNMQFDSKNKSPNIGLSDAARDEIVTLLNMLLSDEFALYARTRGAHWNIIGPQFFSLHKLFEEQYEKLDEIIDETAERARILGGFAVSSLGGFLIQSRLHDENFACHDGVGLIAEILHRHEEITRNLRIDIKICESHGDAGTIDLFTSVLAWHEKASWMLRTSL